MSAITAPRADLSGYVARGYNLMAVALLFLGGLAFGTLVFGEAEFADKIDDGGLLAVGVIAVVWYLVGANRFRLTRWPLALAVAAVVLQVIGVVVERSDSAELGDNIGGMILYVPLLIFLYLQYSRTRDILDRREEEGRLIQFPAA
jgi:hypothetical protein